MGKKLRIAMLGAFPLDTTHINGGVQGYYANLVNGLSQLNDLDLHILTLRPRDYSGKDRIEETNLTLHLLPQYPRFERVRNYRTYQTVINQYLTQILPDLVHAQDAGSDALVALRSVFPTVITVHGIRWEDGKHYSSWIKRLRVFYDSLLTERYAIRHARHLIAISPYVIRYFKNMYRVPRDSPTLSSMPQAISCRKTREKKSPHIFAAEWGSPRFNEVDSLFTRLTLVVNLVGTLPDQK